MYRRYSCGLMAGVIVVVVVFWIIVNGLIGSLIGNAKGRGSEGYWLGALFGPIGWIIVAVMEPTPQVQGQRLAAIQSVLNPPERGASRTCPWCAETIKAAARVCRYCGRDVDPVVPPPDPRGVAQSLHQQARVQAQRAMASDGTEAWQPDPFRRHELRLYRQGRPTSLVKDGVRLSHDEIPGIT